MKRLLYILLLVISWNTLTAQTYQVNNQKIRFMNALGIPAKDTTAANWANAADTSIILIRPQDSTLWYKYKGSFRKVGTGGSAAIVDTTIISTKAYRNKGFDSIRAVYVPFTGSMSNVNLNARELTNVSRLLVNRTSSFQGALQVTTSGGGVLIDADNSNFGLAIRNTSSSNKSWDFSPFNNDFTINEGGVATRLYFQAGGNIGVNNITPTEALDITGNAKATSFIKSGGTSSQFLKADGSVDNNSYITSVDSTVFSTKAWRQKGVDSVSALISPRITDSLRALVRLRAQGSGGIDVQNSSGTSVASFGSGGTTNISLNGSTNVNARLNVTDSIVGVNQRLTGNQLINGTSTIIKPSSSSSGNILKLVGGNYTNDLFGTPFFFGHSSMSLNNNRGIRFTNTNNGIEIQPVDGSQTDVSDWPVLLNPTGGNTIIGSVSNPNTRKLYVAGTGEFTGSLTATAQGNNIVSTIDSTTITTSNYTLVLGDAGKRFYIKNSSSALTVTIPTDASVNFPIGTEIIFFQDGTGDITIAGASGVTVKSGSSLTKLGEQYAFAGVVKLSANTWGFTGNRK